MKKSTVAIIGFVLAAALAIGGLVIKVPPKHISFFSYSDDGYTEYVGGDAYNIIIEAGLRGGEIAGGKAAKAVCFSASALLLFFSLALLADDQGKPGLTTSVPADAAKEKEAGALTESSPAAEDTLTESSPAAEDTLTESSPAAEDTLTESSPADADTETAETQANPPEKQE